MQKVVYPNYERDKFNEPVPVVEPSELLGASPATARLGPLHVPRGVGIDVTADNHCVFRFDYANEEPPEREQRTAGAELSVELGKHTRKVLALYLNNAREQLLKGAWHLDSHIVNTWCEGLQSDRRFVCKRSAEVVQAILDAMPAGLRSEILAQLERMAVARK